MSEKAEVHRNSKNTIFLDIFTTPKYSLEMLKTLHPEMTGLTERDVRLVTLNPVILNGQYNDLALLVRDRLIIFVEAQSTWSVNIILRILLYLAGTYQEYIAERNLNVYGSKKLKIPEPEFFVIYTGKRRIEKEIISLREDFWNNSDVPIDLSVKVIHSENEKDIIGQYIIFTHVLDDQIRIFGRKKSAVESAIRICQDRGVLREYLEGRKKEVVDIMVMLFDQSYAMEVYGRERELEGEKRGEKRGEKKGEKKGKIKGMVEICRKLGVTFDEAVRMVVEGSDLSEDAAPKYVRELWGS
ncbi:MAG: hypothetical protein IJR98_03935 [Synergistaceae bacterium]|nr:hypothetical protein [Synergistaceae bacterium]